MMHAPDSVSHNSGAFSRLLKSPILWSAYSFSPSKQAFRGMSNSRSPDPNHTRAMRNDSAGSTSSSLLLTKDTAALAQPDRRTGVPYARRRRSASVWRFEEVAETLLCCETPNLGTLWVPEDRQLP